jgi:hypothetical protein
MTHSFFCLCFIDYHQSPDAPAIGDQANHSLTAPVAKGFSRTETAGCQADDGRKERGHSTTLLDLAIALGLANTLCAPGKCVDLLAKRCEPSTFPDVTDSEKF